MFYYLLCHRSRTKEQVGLALWPDASSSQLRNNFRVTLYHLRRALGRPEWITFDGSHYAFNRHIPHWIDVEAFESTIAEAQQRFSYTPEQAIIYMEQAISYYRGDYLEDMAAGDWSLLQRDALRRQYLEALLKLGQWLFGQGQYVRAAATFRRILASESCHEEAHRELMRSYVRLGERGSALKCYRTLLERMRDEFGALPDAETRTLYESLRRGDVI